MNEIILSVAGASGEVEAKGSRGMEQASGAAGQPVDVGFGERGRGWYDGELGRHVRDARRAADSLRKLTFFEKRFSENCVSF